MSNIISLYIDKYDIRDNESEEKRIRGIVKKIHEKETIFSDLPFDYMIESEQLELLHYIMTSLPERQIMANMKKIDVDRNYMNFGYQSVKSKKESKDLLENDLEGYCPINLENELLNSRNIIRDKTLDVNDILKYLLQTNEEIIRLYLSEKESFKVCGIKLCAFEYIEDYIDYVGNVLLQMLVYRVINNGNAESLNVIKMLSEKVDEMNKLIDKQLDRQKSIWIKEKEEGINCLSTEFVSKCFSMYVTHRSKLYEELRVKTVLKKEMLDFPHLFGKISAEYEAPKICMSDDEIKLSKNISTEGQHIDKYNDKLETVKIFINIMAKYGSRQCHPSCLQDLKVYFREIFVSKSSYRKRQSPFIVKEYIKQVNAAEQENQPIPEFNKQSQYMFIREKISRGYFREKGLSKEYIEKINFEQNLYDLLLKLYLFYDIYDSLEFIYEVNNKLLNIYKSQLKS